MKKLGCAAVLRIVVICGAIVFTTRFPVARAASVERLTGAADAVVLAQATEWSIDESGMMTVRLRVDRTLFKRELPPETLLFATFQGRGPSARRTVRTESPLGLWFLRESSDSWTILSAEGGSVGSFDRLYYPVRGSDIGPRTTSLTQDDVVLTVARAMASSGGHPWLIREALGDYDSPAVRNFLVEMVEDSDIRAQFTGLYSLLRRGDVPALARLKQYHTAIDDDASGLGRTIPQAMELFFRNPAPDAVELLGSLANDVALRPYLRRAAAHSLAQIHTRESVAPLARLLDSEDSALRKSAVIGLSFFANGVGVHRPDEGPSLGYLNQRLPNEYTTESTHEYLGFDESRETEFIAFWKVWWLEHQNDFRR